MIGMGEFVGASQTGVDFGNPEQLRHYLMSNNEEIRLQFEALARRANEPKYIRLPSGKTLDEMLKDDIPWTGVLWACDSTLAEARREAERRGFRVCDGSHDTPDLRHKFIRGAGVAADAGGTGGCSTDSLSIAIGNHDPHNHDYSGETDAACSACSYTVDAGSTEYVAKTTHTHAYRGSTDNNTAGMSHSTCTQSVDTLPPYYEAIYVRKM